MAFNGLLQGVMQGIKGGADAGVYAAKGLFDDQRKIDVSKQMADIEQEKILLIDKVRREREIADIPLKGAAETQVAIDRGNNPDFLKARENLSISDAAGTIKAKQTRSADSIASEGSGGIKLTQQQKLEYGAAQKEYDLLNSKIVEAQANNTWDPASPAAKSLLVQRKNAQLRMNDILKPSGERVDLSKIDNSDKGANAPATDKSRNIEDVNTDFRGWHAKPAGKSMWGEQQYTVFDSSGASMSGDAFQKKYNMLPQTLTVRQHDIAKDYAGWTSKIDPVTAELVAVNPQGKIVRDFEEKNFVSPQQLPRK